jgi:anti-sigma B factor antagonist
MKFEDFEADGVVVLAISGKIMGGEENTMFHGKLQEHIQAGSKKFVIDLDKVEWMNSLGLGLLISSYTAVKKVDGRLVLANITNIESILAMTRLMTVFDNYDSRDAALASF